MAHLVVDTRESARVDAAVGTPMTAMKRDDNRSFAHEFRKSTEPPALIGQDEFRHRFARLRRILSKPGALQTRHHPVDDLGEFGTELAHVLGKGVKACR